MYFFFFFNKNRTHHNTQTRDDSFERFLFVGYSCTCCSHTHCTSSSSITSVTRAARLCTPRVERWWDWARLCFVEWRDARGGAGARGGCSRGSQQTIGTRGTSRQSCETHFATHHTSQSTCSSSTTIANAKAGNVTIRCKRYLVVVVVIFFCLYCFFFEY